MNCAFAVTICLRDWSVCVEKHAGLSWQHGYVHSRQMRIGADLHVRCSGRRASTVDDFQHNPSSDHLPFVEFMVCSFGYTDVELEMSRGCTRRSFLHQTSQAYDNLNKTHISKLTAQPYDERETSVLQAPSMCLVQAKPHSSTLSSNLSAAD